MLFTNDTNYTDENNSYNNKIEINLLEASLIFPSAFPVKIAINKKIIIVKYTLTTIELKENIIL